MAAPKGNQYAKGHGRPPLTPSVRKALKALQRGSPRAAARLLELVDSEDAQVSVAAIKIVLSKVLPDMKETNSPQVNALVMAIGAEARRAAFDALQTLSRREDGSEEAIN